jgi:hypothetical protein
MKIATIVSLALLLVTTGTAYKKEPEIAFVVEGKWEGKLGWGSTTPTRFIGLNLITGGQLERFTLSDEIDATGNWNIKGNTFTAEYSFQSGTIVNLTATLDKGRRKLYGTWENNAKEAGTWYIIKKN